MCAIYKQYEATWVQTHTIFFLLELTAPLFNVICRLGKRCGLPSSQILTWILKKLDKVKI